MKYFPLIFVEITRMGSRGQLHFESSISELRYLPSRPIFSDSPLARMITELIKVLPFGCSSLFTADIISYRSKMSSHWFTLSCKCTGTLLALCFLKTASDFKGKCNGELTFPHQIWMLRKLLDISTIICLICRGRFVLFESVENKHC